MKFLVDAQLPRRFCLWLNGAGQDALHTLDLPGGNRTTDGKIIEFAEREQRIVISKDDDFVQSYLIKGLPSRLLFISTGNISNDELEMHLKAHLGAILEAFETSRFIEMGKDFYMVRE
jgi:predicted nuclease of predicted toxin-antitoxin system